MKNNILHGITAEMVMRERAKRHLLPFARYIDPKLQITPFHDAYYRIVDMFAHKQIRKLIIQAPPQHGKSQCSSRYLPAYIAGLAPDTKIALASYASTIARDFNRDVQRIIDTEEYRQVFPETYLNGSGVVTESSNYLRNSDVIEFMNHKGCFRVVGRGGSLTSKTVDVMILDDLYKDYAEGNSPIIREAVWDWYTSVVVSRLHNESQQLIAFTRWNKDDVVGRIMKLEKYIVVTEWKQLENVPADTWIVANFEALKTTEPNEIDPREIGEALWLERHSIELLEQKRLLDGIKFQCLYQGNPGDASGLLYQPFKMWVDKSEYGTLVRKGCYVDVADDGDDFLAGATYDIYRSQEQAWNEVTRRFEPILYALVTDVEFTDENTDVTTITIPRMINANGTEKAWIESNNGGSQFEKKIRTKVKASTVAFYQGANKESRIITNAAFVNQSIIMPFGWEKRYPKFYEHITGFLRLFKANEHDDGADLLTGIYEKEIANGNTLPYNRASKGVTIR